MKFINPVLQQAICEIRFKPILKVHELRFGLVEEFSEELPHWSVNWNIIESYNNIKKVTVKVTTLLLKFKEK